MTTSFKKYKDWLEIGTYHRAKEGNGFTDIQFREDDGTWSEVEWMTFEKSDVIRIVDRNINHLTCIGVSKKNHPPVILKFKLKREQITGFFTPCFDLKGVHLIPEEKIVRTAVPAIVDSEWA